eukprot:661312-Amphidinium_carterae.1
MEGFHNPGLDVGWETKATHPMHGLLKSADPFLLYRVSPARPLGVHPQITSSDFNWGKKTGMPGPLKLVFSVRTNADDHRLLRVHLHIGLLGQSRKVRSGSNQDHIIHILADFNLPSRTL